VEVFLLDSENQDLAPLNAVLDDTNLESRLIVLTSQPGCLTAIKSQCALIHVDPNLGESWVNRNPW